MLFTDLMWWVKLREEKLQLHFIYLRTDKAIIYETLLKHFICMFVISVTAQQFALLVNCKGSGIFTLAIFTCVCIYSQPQFLMSQVAIIEKYFLLFFLSYVGRRISFFPIYKAVFKREEELKSEFSIDNSVSFWKYLNSSTRHKKS